MLKPLTMEGMAAELRRIREKIDAQFARFRQAPSKMHGVDLQAAMLMPLVLDDYADRRGRCSGGVRTAVRPAPGPGRPAVLYGDGVHPAE